MCTSPLAPCAATVAGVCCKQTVNSLDSQATKDYLAALDALLGAGCKCEVFIACPTAPSNKCVPGDGAPDRCATY